jgi:hypothetical protein
MNKNYVKTFFPFPTCVVDTSGAPCAAYIMFHEENLVKNIMTLSLLYIG